MAIIGAGPAGLLLSQLLSRRGIDSVIVEAQSRAHVEGRIRAGVLEQGTVDVLRDAGVGDRLMREGLQHSGMYLQWPGERHRIDLAGLTGRSIWVYGQIEVVKDLLAARLADGQVIHFNASNTAVHDVETDRPSVTFTDLLGARTASRPPLSSAPTVSTGSAGPASRSPGALEWHHTYPHAWLGILADVPPSTDELIYAWHPHGFAMHSMRSTRLSRLYLQVSPCERLQDWPDERVWDELRTRLGLDGWTLRSGPVLHKSITPMRGFVGTPMRHGRLFLVGDAAHIVPPTGAKGLNLAVADVAVLADALHALFDDGCTELVDGYEQRALQRVWATMQFSTWMTSMLHVTSTDGFELAMQAAQLRYTCTSPAAATSLAERYVGLPLDTGRRAATALPRIADLVPAARRPWVGDTAGTAADAVSEPAAEPALALAEPA